MMLLGYAVLVLLGLVVLLLLIAVLHTLLVRPAPLPTAQPLPVDEARAQEYGRRLAPLIQCETISSRFDESREKFFAFHKVLESTFPLVHERCEKHVFNGSLLFCLRGSGTQQPMMMMSHHDVVEAGGAWEHPPFCGEIIDGKLWGRGTVDTKASLFCILSSVEELLAEGYTPPGDLYIASSCTEEWSGEGAPLTAQYLKENGVELGLLLDEGGMMMENPIVGVQGRFAMVGVLEKGYGDIKFTARSGGGHASAPGCNTPLARLAAFVCEVERKYPFRVEFSPTVREMFGRLSRGMGFPMRLVFQNLWLFGPVLKPLLRRISPSAAAMMQTTCAFTTAQGSGGLNVLPQEAYITANMRFIPHQGVDESRDILKRIADKHQLEMEDIVIYQPCPVVDYTSAQFMLLERTVAELFPACVTSPYVMTGGTDVKSYGDVCKNGLRFAPLAINQQQYGSIHGLNENISLATLPGGVDFYKQMVRGYFAL